MDHAGLIGLRALFDECDPHVFRAIPGAVLNDSPVRDSVAFSEASLLLLGHCLQTLNGVSHGRPDQEAREVAITWYE